MAHTPLSQTTIQEHMTKSPKTIACHESLQSAAALMREHKFRHLPVMQSSTLVGILSLHDVHRIEAIEQIDAGRILVTEAMTPQPFQCAPQDKLVDVAAQMAKDHIGSAVVVDKGQVVGIYTAQDALRSLVSSAR